MSFSNPHYRVPRQEVASEAAVAPYMIETAPHTTAVAKVVKDQAAYISLLEATTP